MWPQYFQEKYGGDGGRPGVSSTNKTTPCSPQDEPSQPVAGVIGAAFSGVSIMVANILKLFKVSFSQTEQQRLSFMFSFNKHFINYNLSLKRKKCKREYNTDTHIISDPISDRHKKQTTQVYTYLSSISLSDSPDQLRLHVSGIV